MRFFRCLSLLLLLLMLAVSACGPSTINAPAPSGSQPRGTKPYTIRGQTYHPLISADGFSEEGIASWYGKDFHGKKTANGESYDMYGQTAAHKLLPFGTKVKVTNLDNGRSTIVRINDRGPFIANRVIDLTHTAANQINMLGPGTARVRVETIGAVPGLASGDLKGSFFIQIGAFSDRNNANNAVARLRASGYNARITHYAERNMWRVQAGPWQSLNDAENAQDNLSATFTGAFVVAD